MTITLVGGGLDVTFAEGGLDDGALVFAVGGRLVVEVVEEASLFAECRTDAAGELRERIGGRQEAVSQFPFALIKGVVPFGSFVAKRTSPVAEGHTTVHATTGLELAVVSAEGLFNLSEVFDSLVNGSVTCLLAGHS
jgi:hypothetical protein